MRRRTALLIALAGVALLSSCDTARYLWQAAEGQLSLLRSAKPIADVLANSQTPAETHRKLELARRVRDFALTELGLPDHGSFRSFVDLKRPHVVWNVFSAPELSLDLRTKCFPVVGCVTYQGFFREVDARAEEQKRRASGDDVMVGGVSAYSTLGYLKDPILSSMFTSSDAWLVRTIIHELSHPALYVAGDTMFSESYATTIENEGMKRWLARYGTPELAAQDAQERGRNEQWQALSLNARGQLAQLYARNIPDAEKRQEKTKILDDLQTRATALRREWFGPDASPAPRQNNASLGAVATYADLVPAFEGLLARVNGDIPTFIREARECAAKPKEARAACLQGK